MGKVNDPLSGILIMDTCCFLNFLRGKGAATDRFDYSGVKEFIGKSGFQISITPYTLYECIQGCDTLEKFLERRGEMLALWDFWVLNLNGILPEGCTFEFGPDFVFSVTTAEGFVARRRELREKVYTTLIPRIILLAQLIAVVYLLVTERREDGTYPGEMRRRIQYALSGYFQEEPIFKVQLYSYFESPDNLGLTIREGELVRTSIDAKDKLSEIIHGFATQIMNVTRVIMDEKKLGVAFSIGELNSRIVQEEFRKAGHFPMDEMRKQGKDYLKRNKNVITLDRYVDNALQGYDTIFKHLYKKVLIDWFSGGVGKKLFNTIIDYVNTGTLESFSNAPVIYMTEETKFIDLVMSLNTPQARLTQRFYKQYYTNR